VNLELFHPTNLQNIIKAVIFDKDGTLLDLNATWGAAMSLAAIDVCTDSEQLRLLSNALGLDIENKTFYSDSLTPENDAQTTSLIISTVTDPIIFSKLTRTYADETATKKAGASELLKNLSENNIPVAMATNDSENSAKRFVKSLGWQDYFNLVLGFDSGFGSKPGPGMINHCSEEFAVEPKNLLMVGDTKADLLSAEAAKVSYIQIGELNNHIATADYIKINSLDELIPLLNRS